MPKKATKSEKLGRDEVISDKNLSERYDSLKQFLENNWGRIGLKLQRVRKPSDVSSTFKLIPQVEWCSPFRDYRATCLLDDGSGPVGIRELRVLQRITEDAAEVEDKLWSEYHAASQQAQTARTNLNTLIGEFRANAGLFPFFYVVFVIAKELRVQELNNKFAAVE